MKIRRTKTGSGRDLPGAPLVLLSDASAREDQMLLPPPSLRACGSALEKVLSGLLRKHLVEEVVVQSSEQAWRGDETANRIGLRSTAEGLKAIGVPALASAAHAAGSPAEEESPAMAGAEPAERGAARRMSKQLQLIERLRQSKGAKMDDLVAELGWQRHTVRAALTGLRRKGMTIECSRDGEGKAVYRIIPPQIDEPPRTAQSGPSAPKVPRKQRRAATARQPVEA